MTSAYRIAMLTALFAAAGSAPGRALVINPLFDSTVTSLADAGTVESAFNQAASRIDAMFANPVTVNINVSWGSIQGQALPSNALGTSSTSLYGYYGYSSIASMLQGSATTAADRSAYAGLPASAPVGQSRYVITSAQAKALGTVAPTGGVDGSIGFGGPTRNYTFSESRGIAAGTYDFLSVAEHEITEVMGRISGLSSATPSFATIADLFRFSGTGVDSWGYNSPAYFSIDNGATDLANFNHSSSGGDRGDWLSSSLTSDAADAFTYPGTVNALSSLDQTELDVIGWGSTGTGSGGGSVVSTVKGAAEQVPEQVPEPGTLGLLAGVAAAAVWRRRWS